MKRKKLTKKAAENAAFLYREKVSRKRDKAGRIYYARYDDEKNRIVRAKKLDYINYQDFKQNRIDRRTYNVTKKYIREPPPSYEPELDISERTEADGYIYSLNHTIFSDINEIEQAKGNIYIIKGNRKILIKGEKKIKLRQLISQINNSFFEAEREAAEKKNKGKKKKNTSGGITWELRKVGSNSYEIDIDEIQFTSDAGFNEKKLNKNIDNDFNNLFK